MRRLVNAGGTPCNLLHIVSDSERRQSLELTKVKLKKIVIKKGNSRVFIFIRMTILNKHRQRDTPRAGHLYSRSGTAVMRDLKLRSENKGHLIVTYQNGQQRKCNRMINFDESS